VDFLFPLILHTRTRNLAVEFFIAAAANCRPLDPLRKPPMNLLKTTAAFILGCHVIAAHADCTITPVPIGHIGSSTCNDSTIYIPAPGIIGTVNQSAVVLRDGEANDDMTVYHYSGWANVWGETAGTASYDVYTRNNLNYQTNELNIQTNDLGSQLSTGILLQAGKNIVANIASFVSTNNAIGLKAISENGSVHMLLKHIAFTNHIAGIQAESNGGDIHIEIQNDTSWITVDDNGIGIDALDIGSNENTIINIVSNAAIRNAQRGIQAVSHAGNIAITNNNHINANTVGIHAHADLGQIVIHNYANVTGTQSAAILGYANGAKPIYIGSHAGVLTGAIGIVAENNSGDIVIENSSVINSTQTGISAKNDSGHISLSNRNTINTDGYGIFAQSSNGNIDIVSDGAINAQSGIIALSESAENLTYITVLSDITASGNRQSTAVQIESAGNGTVFIGANASLNTANGIELNTASDSIFEIYNHGTIDVLTDNAVTASGGGHMVFENAGTLYGNVTLDATTLFINSGQWLLRNLTGSEAFHVRDTKSIAISQFGDNSQLQNNGVIALDHTTALFLNSHGEYVPVGALSLEEGASHAQLLGLSVFEQNENGVIDLTGNHRAGDVLVISGGQSAGQNGGGLFISNGGAIKLDTVLNAGDSQSLSDMLVIDNVVLGSAATKIWINPMSASVETSTVNDGIKIIEVLGSSDTGAFTLAAPVTYGIYEYRLSQGKNDDSWYLRNHDSDDNGGGSGGGSNGGSGEGSEGESAGGNNSEREYFYNPNMGSFLGSQYAASEMFYQSKSDRQNELHSYDSPLWLRTKYSHLKTDLLQGKQSAHMTTSVFQIGVDLLQTDHFMTGIYGGIGNASVANRSNQTGSSAHGSVKGHNIGLYATWAPDEYLGPYVDVWACYAWFNNRLSGPAQTHTVQYRSRAISLSAEAGHSFILQQYQDGSALLMQPHGQFSFTQMNSDGVLDSHNTHYTDGLSSGMKARTGVKVAKSLPSGAFGLAPYAEFNWLVNDVNHSIKMNSQKMTTEIGKNVAEVKVGIQGKTSSNVSIWGHIGTQRGSQRFVNSELQVGLGITF